MPPHRRDLALLLLATALAFLPALAAGHVWDDHALIVDNPLLRDPVDLVAVLRGDLWQAARGEPSGYHRPLVLLSFLLDQQLAPGDPALAHLHSLAWHLAAVAGVHTLLRRFVPAAPAVLGATLFALHPAQVEAVTWVAARNDLMAVALGAGGTAALLSSRRLVGAGLLLAGLLSKEGALAWVLAAPLLALLERGPASGAVHEPEPPRGASRPGRRAAAEVALASLGAALVWLALRALSEVRAVPVATDALTPARALLALSEWSRTVLWPVQLSASRHLDWLEVSPLWLLAALALACGLVARGRARAAAGLALAALSLAPAVLVALATQDLVAERYLYQPLAGLALALAAARPPLPRPAALVLALACLLPVQRRLPAWRDDVALYTADHAATPSPYTAGQLGLALLGQGRRAEGRALLLQALAGAPPHCAAATPLLALDAPGTDLVQLAHTVAAVQASGCADADQRSWLTLALARLGRWAEARAMGESVRGYPGHGAWRPGLAAAVRVTGEGAEPEADAEAVRKALEDGGRGDLAAW